MPDYQLGKIYKIVDNTNNNVYIGSTCKILKQRLSGHVSVYKHYLKGKNNYVTSFDILENNDYEILLVESFPCDYKDELLARERYWTNKIDCINKNKNQGLINEIGRGEYNKQFNKQYYVEHQDHLKEKEKQYRKDHHEQIKEWKTTKCTCVCGGMYTLVNKSQHVKTSKHIEYVKSETIKNCLINNLSFEETYQKYKTQ